MLNKIFENIKNKIPMALIRFGDGEKNILNNISCQRSGFSFDPGDIRDREFQYQLIKALQFNGGKNYFVGINDQKLEEKVNGTIISPMIFVNQNYLSFLDKLKLIGNDIPIFLVVNKISKLISLPFPFLSIFGLDDNAWHTAKDLDRRILDTTNLFDKPCLILIAGGAYSCVLIHKIWQRNQDNILLDIGSTLDPWLFGQNTREYHKRLKNDS